MSWTTWVSKSVKVWDDTLVYGTKWKWYLQLDYQYRQDLDARITQINIIKYIWNMQSPSNQYITGTLAVGVKYGDRLKEASIKVTSSVRNKDIPMDITYEIEHDDDGVGVMELQWFATQTSKSLHAPHYPKWQTLSVNFPTMEASGIYGFVNFLNGSKKGIIWVKTSNGSKKLSDIIINNTNNEPFEIYRQPSDDISVNGGYVDIGVSGQNVTYTWQVDKGSGWENKIVNGTKSNCSVSGGKANNGHKYRCIATNGDGRTLTSNVVIYYYIPKNPTIQEQSGDVEFTQSDVGTYSQLSVVANSSRETKTYVWYKKKTNGNWVDLGVNNMYLNVKIESDSNGDQYKCIVLTESGSGVESEVITFKLIS